MVVNHRAILILFWKKGRQYLEAAFTITQRKPIGFQADQLVIQCGDVLTRSIL